MKKFIVYTRAMHGVRKADDAPTVIEVEGEMVKGIEDPSIMWLPEGEFKFRIMKPESLYEPHEIVKEDKTKEKVLIPPVYDSHAIYWTACQALVHAEKMVRQSFEFAKSKHKIDFTEEEVRVRYSEIKEILL